MAELKKIRMHTDVTMAVSIVDNNIAIHTADLSQVLIGLYSVNQKALVARCDFTPAGDELIIKSPAHNQRFEGQHRLVISCAMGERKATYDAMAFEVVKWSGDVIPPQDLEEASEPIGIRIEFNEISSSLVHELLAATIAATDAANTATENAVNVTELANDAADKATTQASAAEEGAIRANAAAQLAETNAVQASNATEKAVTATTNAESATADAVQATEAARLATTNATEAAVSANVGASSANEAASAARAATENAVAATGEAQQASDAANAAADRANEASVGIEGVMTEIESLEVLIEDLQNSKVDKEADDYYPQLSVGVADNLAGHEDATPSEIGFRRSGGGAILDGNARIEAIKGNSVVWNQLVPESLIPNNNNFLSIAKSGNSYSFTVTNSIVINQLSAKISQTSKGGHIYLFIRIGDNSLGKTPTLKLGTSYLAVPSEYNFLTAADESTITFYPWGGTAETISEGEATYTLCLFDLTKMFGAGNEPTTIEEFYARIPQNIDLNAYNEGEVIHNATDKIESVGVNQWDEEWELGKIDFVTGTLISSTTSIRSKNFCRIEEGLKHYAKGIGSNYYIVLYDKDYNYVNVWLVSNSRDNIVPEPKSKYFKITLLADYGTTYNHDICINLSDPSVNGKYFPYVKREQNLDIIGKYFPNGMKSAGTAHDEIRFNKTTQKWEAVKRIGEVDLGSLDFKLDSRFDNAQFYAKSSAINTNILCGRYVTIAAAWDTNKDKTITRTPDGNILIVDSAYTDAATFKAAMAGVMLYYELAEPIVTEIEETINLDYPVWNVGTEKAIANVPSTPLKADIIYGFNAYGVIKELLARVASLEAANASLASQLASVTSHNEEV